MGNATQATPVVLDNIVFSLQATGGASVYWGNVLSSADQAPDIDLHIVERTDARLNEVRKGLTLKSPITVQDGQAKRVAQFATIKPPVEGTIVHSSCYRVAKASRSINVTTVHDFIWQYYTSGLNRAIHMSQIRHAVNQSDAIICVSNSTKDDLLKLVPSSRKKLVTVIHHGFDSSSYRYVQQERKNQVVFIGARTSYKNFEVAVESVSACLDLKLIVIGSQPNVDETRLLNEKIPGRWESIVYPSAESVAQVYQQSLALLYLSDYEGFGLPVLEAMASGAPVIAINRSSIPEVAGEAGILIDEASPNLVAKEIERLRSGGDWFSRVVSAGLCQAKKFSWDKSMSQTLDFYRDVYREFSHH